MKVSVFIATSLDGFIARSNGALDWLPSDGDEQHGYTEFIATVDGIVMGRNTFETILSFDTWPYGNTPVVVLTERPLKFVVPQGAVCEVMAGAPRDIVTKLAERGMKHIYLDGGVTVQRFLIAGFVHRLILTRVPVLLGNGIPLFGPVSRDIRFHHISTRSYPSGLVQSEYSVAP